MLFRFFCDRYVKTGLFELGGSVAATTADDAHEWIKTHVLRGRAAGQWNVRLRAGRRKFRDRRYIVK